MAMSQINDSLLVALEKYYKTCRYQGVVCSSRDLVLIQQLADAVRQTYQNFECWGHPTLVPAPPLGNYITDYCRLAFQTQRTGLIIVEPENWLFQWTRDNQRTFWCHLGGIFGRYPIIVIAKDVRTTTEHLDCYFNAKPIDGIDARLWLPNKINHE